MPTMFGTHTVFCAYLDEDGAERLLYLHRPSLLLAMRTRDAVRERADVNGRVRIQELRILTPGNLVEVPGF